MAYALPLPDTTRAESELGWTPGTDALATLAETVRGMQEAASERTPVLRPRTVAGAMSRFVRRGPVSSRRTP